MSDRADRTTTYRPGEISTPAPATRRDLVRVYLLVALGVVAIAGLVGWGLHLYHSGGRAAVPSGDGTPVDIDMRTGRRIDFAAMTEDAKVERARRDMRDLSQLTEEFKAQMGHYPVSLKILTEPRRDNWKGIPDEWVIDPWGKPYQIDPKGYRNNGRKADVFTTLPDGKTIGNFAD